VAALPMAVVAAVVRVAARPLTATVNRIFAAAAARALGKEA
jgi:hypothetical protein